VAQAGLAANQVLDAVDFFVHEDAGFDARVAHAGDVDFVARGGDFRVVFSH
jgi:hypothetical protein